MTDLITKDTSLELTKFDTDEGKIVAYVTTFNNQDKEGDIIAPGALDKWVKEFKQSESRLPMLWQHDKKEVIGQWTDFEINTRGVKGYGEIYTDVTRGNDVRNLIKRGAVGSVSIGFKGRGREMEKGGRYFEEVELFETSVVLTPANQRAKIVSVKDDQGLNPTLLEAALRDVGLSKKESKIIINAAASELRDVISKELAKDKLLHKLKSAMEKI